MKCEGVIKTGKENKINGTIILLLLFCIWNWSKNRADHADFLHSTFYYMAGWLLGC